MRQALIAIAMLCGTAQMASAVDYDTALQAFLTDEVVSWAQDPVIVAAVKAQNTLTTGYTAEKIAELDGQWVSEIGAASAPLVGSVMENDASTFLRQQMDASGGAIFEIFVMDAQGLNVASTGVTSDYWQGDEAKFQESYGKGASGVHYGAVEFDESSQQYQAQISFSLKDPASGAPIGAIVVGVNPDSLM